MVILNGTNLGSSSTPTNSLPSPPDSLPSPARGSPAGLSPNKSTSSSSQLNGLERMLTGWRHHAQKKAEQIRQRELAAAPKRRKEQEEVNEIRLRIIESRMKKLDQQQATGRSKNNGSMIGDTIGDQSRKRRSDDDFCLGTPSDGGFACDSPDSFGFETNGGSATKNPKFQTARGPTPLPVERNASVFIETFQLPPPQHPMQQQPIRRSNVERPAGPVPAYSMTNCQASMPYPAGFHFASSASAGSSTMPSSSCMQQQRPMVDPQPQRQDSSTAFRGQQIHDVTIPRDIEEQLILSQPIDLKAALSPDFLKAIDDLEQPVPNSTRIASQPRNQMNKGPNGQVIYDIDNTTINNSTAQYPWGRGNGYTANNGQYPNYGYAYGNPSNTPVQMNSMASNPQNYNYWNQYYNNPNAYQQWQMCSQQQGNGHTGPGHQ